LLWSSCSTCFQLAGRKRYSSVAEVGSGTPGEAEIFDVTSLRERLQEVVLDVDGSKEMSLKRWKDHLRNGSTLKKRKDVDAEHTFYEIFSTRCNPLDKDWSVLRRIAIPFIIYLLKIYYTMAVFL